MAGEVMAVDGLRVGVTSERKGAELAGLFERHGATVIWGPTLVNRPADDAELEAETKAVLAADLDWFVATTGAGMRAWLSAADAAGVGEPLRSHLAGTRAVARSPKADGGLRLAGLKPEFVSVQETDADTAAWLAARVQADDTVAVQLHGAQAPGPYGHLENGGARLLCVTPARCTLPDDRRPAEALVARAVAGELDLVVATSAPAATNLFAIAEGVGLAGDLRAALSGPVAVAAVGPVTARAFEDAGVGIDVMPRRARTADLVSTVQAWAERRRADGGGGDRHVPGVRLLPQARAVRVGEEVVVLGPLEFAVLASLVRRQGIVCSPAMLSREVWGHRAPKDATTVKHQISRLRRKLGAAGGRIVTVRGVGYRYEPVTVPP